MLLHIRQNDELENYKFSEPPIRALSWGGAIYALKVKMHYFSFLSNSFLRADSLSIK